MDKVALCVLSYNGWKVSERFIDLLYEHTDVDNFHLCWIDNGSSDETPKRLDEVLSDFPNTTVIYNDNNEGVIGGRNIGFDWYDETGKKECDYFMLLDNDQFVQPGWLEQHMAVLKYGYDMVGVEAWQMNRSFAPVKKNTLLKEWYSYVGCGGTLMKREVYESVGKFDEIFNPSYFEDPDFNFRAIDNGFQIGWNIKARIVHMPHQTLGNVKDKHERFIRSMQRFKQKWKNRMPPMKYQHDIPPFHSE